MGRAVLQQHNCLEISASVRGKVWATAGLNRQHHADNQVLMNMQPVIINHLASSAAGLTSGNLTLETLAFSGSSRSLPTQDWNSGRRDSASSAGSMRYTNSNAFLERSDSNVRQDDAATAQALSA